jgi:hypothetical protein
MLMIRPAISVVVINHNYAEYLGEAIDSALAQTYPVQILVVDDGSTDTSRTIIDGYGGRVRSLFKDNGGNSSVINAAVPATSGDVVMFLDADDLLHPEAAAAVADAWQEGCSKVQFRLSLIDAAGERRGVDPAREAPMPTGDVVPQLVATGRYVTPVTTGNAFRRTVLEEILPIPEKDFRNTNDGYLNLISPFHGPVVSIDRELGSYRLHGSNLWAFSGAVDLPGIRQRVRYDLTRQRYLIEAARPCGHEVAPDLPLTDPVHVFQRLVSLRLDPVGHPAPGDSPARLLRAGLKSIAVGRSGAEAVQRAVLAFALPLAVVLPRPVLLRLAEVVLLSRPRGPIVRAVGRTARWLLAAPDRWIGRGVATVERTAES